MRKCLLILVVLFSSMTFFPKDSVGQAFNQDGTPRDIVIFVGPQMRDGFRDIDRNIRDSIGDIRNQLRRTGIVRPVPSEEEALISLEILGRGLSGTSGAVGVPGLGGTYMTVPIKERSVVARLTVGTYEMDFIAQGDSWTESAEDIAEHLVVWINANRERLREYLSSSQ